MPGLEKSVCLTAEERTVGRGCHTALQYCSGHRVPGTRSQAPHCGTSPLLAAEGNWIRIHTVGTTQLQEGEGKEKPGW